jgi:hypothetical protein
MAPYPYAELLSQAATTNTWFQYAEAPDLYCQLLAITNPDAVDPIGQGSRYKAYAEQGAQPGCASDF